MESAELIAVHTFVSDNESTEQEEKVVYLAELSGIFNRENFSEELAAGFSSSKFYYTVIGKLSDVELEEEQFKDKKDIYSLRCTTKGRIGNIDKGELIPVEYIEGLDTAKLAGIITSGRDEEDTEHLRQRYFEHVDVNAFAFGGNIADYKAKVLSLSTSENGQGDENVRKEGGVGYVKVEPAWDGAGTVKIIILDASYQAALTDNPSAEDYLTGHPLIVAVQEAVDPKQGEGAGVAPIGHKVTVFSAKEKAIHVFAQIEYVDDNEFNKNSVESVLEEYFVARIKAWESDEELKITIGEIYRCIESVPCVCNIENLQNMTLNGGSEVKINIDSIPVLGGLDDGQSS